MNQGRWPGPLGAHNRSQTKQERRNLQTIIQGTADFNARNVEGTASSFSENYEWISPFFDFRTLRGAEQTKWGLSEVLRIFPDVHYEIMINIAQGPFTQTASHVSGTQIDGFMGFPFAQVPYQFVVTILNKFDEAGRRLWTWEMFDRVDVLRQAKGGISLPGPVFPVESPRDLPRTMPASEEAFSEVPPYRPGGGKWQAVEQRNYESVTRGIVAFNARDAEGSVADLSPESIWYSNALPAPIVGREPAAKWIAKSFEILPDTTFEVVQMFAWQNNVQVLFRATGTKSLGFLGMPPSDRPFEYFRSVLSRYDQNGQRAMVWDVWEEAQILRAQGFLSPLPPFGSQASRSVTSLPVARAISPPGLRIVGVAGQITGTDLEALERKAGSQLDVEARAMLQRLASFDLVGRLVRHELPGGPQERNQGIWEIDLLETTVRESIVASVGRSIGQARLSWRVLPTSEGIRARESLFPVEVEGDIQLTDARRSRIRLRGEGFAQGVPGSDFLFGAVLSIESGSGAFQKKPGLVTISAGGGHGWTARVVLRCNDSVSSLRSTSGRSKTGEPSLDSGDLVITLEGGEDPEQPVQFEFGQDGNFTGALAHEKLYLADLDSGFHGTRLKARSRRLAAAGSSRFEVRFAASTAMPAGGIPYTTQNAHLCFYDAAQREIGSLEADIVWGRAFPTEIPGIEVPAFRMGGLAPITGGHGLFQGARGWIAVNSLFSLVPQIISSVLTLHLAAPSRELSQGLIQAWR